MAERESSPGISPAKKRIRYRSVSNFIAEYTRRFDWVMASDRGMQQANCKVCSKHFSVSHGGIDDVCRHGETDFKKKITDFPRVVPHFFFRNLTCLALCRGLLRSPTVLVVYFISNTIVDLGQIAPQHYGPI